MRYAWLCHPVTVAGVLVLLINDHLLKHTWPGFVTGKLSDVAGLVVAPALLALLLPRRADLAAIMVTGVAFALVKTTETGAELASQGWTLVAGSSRVLADPTDLLALPALALAWWVRARSLRQPSSSRWRIIVTMPLALIAVTATSSATPPFSAESVEVDSGGRISVPTYGRTTWISDDGGLSWSQITGDHDPRPGQSAQCVPGQATRCYRITGARLGVEQSDDGGRTWQPSWEVTGDALERVSRQYGGLPTDLRSKALAVQARPGGHVVIVANGMDGLAIRDTSGTWRRIGWPGLRTVEVDMDPEWGVALFLAACVLFGGVGAGLRRYTRAYTGSAVAACLGLLLLLNGWPVASSDDWLPLRVLGFLALLTGGVICVVLAATGRTRPAAAAVGVLAAPLVYASVYLPFEGWARGTPESYSAAAALATLLTAVVVLTSAALIRRDARQPKHFPDE